MESALVIGGTGFVGRHTVAELLDHDYAVTVVSRGTWGESTVPDDVTYRQLDRTDSDALAATAQSVSPGVVVDCAAFRPESVRDAVTIFADVDAYVYVSSGGVYASHEIPKREDETRLHEFSEEHAGDETMESYGPRKAECDRLARAAVDQGVATNVVRPTMIYGPKTVRDGEPPVAGSVSWAADLPGIQTHHDYWIDRVNRYDRVVVPGDGTAIWHRAYVEDVAAAIRVVAEEGRVGSAYNVGDRTVLTMEDVIDLIANTLDTSVDVVHANRRELADVGLEPDNFVLYHHLGYNYPHVLETCRLTSLGWESTPPAVAMERTVEESLASDRDGSAFDPGRDAEERLLNTLTP